MSSAELVRQQVSQLLDSLVPPPSLKQEVARLIAVHGAEAVKREVRAATKPRRGRKQEKDWLPLRPYIEADARDWLNGRDPFALRKNKAIAREVAAANPNKFVLPESLQRRFERKLARDRKRFMLYSAWELARHEYPIAAHFRALKELVKLDRTGDTWQRILALDEEIFARYCVIYGEPDPQTTWQDLESKPRYPDALAALSPKPQLDGLFDASIFRGQK